MLRRKSTHKRKSSSARADQTKKSDSGRIIANTIWNHQGKTKIESQDLTQSRLLQCIDIPLLHSLDVLIPCPSSSTSTSVNRLIDSLSQNSNDEQFQRTQGATYLIRNAPLSLFLDPAFLTSHIRSGTLTMISSGSLDSEDVVCLDGKGTLILSVTKETYQTLGLTGRPSRFSRGSSGWAGDRRSGKHQRFIIEIDLLSPTFTPVHKGYKNVKKILDNWDLNRRNSNESSKPSSRSGGKAAQDGRKDELSSLLDVLNSGKPSVSTSKEGTTPSQEGQKSENGAAKIGSWDLLLNWVPSPQSIQSSSSSTSTSNLNAEPKIPTIHFPPHLLPILQPREIKQEIRSRIEEDVFLPDFNSRSSIDQPERDTLHDLVYGWKEDHKETNTSEKKFDRSEKDGMDLDEADPLAGEEDTAASILAFEEWKERILGLGEWAGMNLDERGSEKFKTFNRFSTYTSSYSPSFPLTEGKLIHLSFKGLLGPQFVQCVNEKIDGWIKEERKTSQKTNGKDELLWAISLAKCFKDSPISWNLSNKKKIQGSERKGKGKEAVEDQEIEPNDLREEELDTRERKRVRFSEVGRNQDQEQSLILEDGDGEDDDEDDTEDGDFQSESEEEQSSSSDEDEEKETPEGSHQASKSSSKPFSKDKERKKRKKRGFVRSGERERATRFGRDDSTGFLILNFGDQDGEDEGQVELEAQADEVKGTAAGKKRRRDGTEIEGQKRKEPEAVENGLEPRRRRARWIVLEGVGLDSRN